MKPLARPFPPVKTAAACHDWLTAEDVLKHALAAFYALCRHLERHEAEMGAGAFHGDIDRKLFADDLAEIFRCKLQDLGYRVKAPGFDHWGAEITGWWLTDTSADAPARSAEYVDNSPRNPG